MRKVFLSIFLLFFLVYATTLLFGRLDNRIDLKKDLDLNITRIKCDSKFPSLDILFLGSSYTYSSINTKILDSANIKSYVLGEPSGGPVFADLLLTDYVNTTHTIPRYIALDISPITFSFQSDNYKDFPIFRYLNYPLSNERYCLMYERSLTSYIKSTFKSFFTGIDQLKSGVEHANHSKEFADMISVKGYRRYDITSNDSIIKGDESYYTPFKNASYLPRKEKDLFNFIKNWGGKTHIIINIIPHYKLNNYFSADFISKYDHLLNTLKEEKNISFIEVSGNYDITNFRNIDHMNYNGASHFTREFILALKKQGLM